MKLSDKSKKSKNKPIKLTVHGEDIYMRNLTMGEVDILSAKAKEFGKLEDDADGETAALKGYGLIDLIFKEVLVDRDGEQYDEVKDGKSAEEICKDLPMAFVRDIISAVMDSIAGVERGN